MENNTDLEYDNTTVTTQHPPLPLALQDAINNTRNFAVFFATTYGLVALLLIFDIIFSPSGPSAIGLGGIGFYVIITVVYVLCANKLSMKRTSIKPHWAVTTAALGILSAISILGILIEVSLWRNVHKINKYNKQGPAALVSDEEWAAKHKRTWSDTRQVVTAIIGGVVVTVIIIGIYALSHFVNPSGDMSSKAIAPYTSTQYGFSIDFPGIPTSKNSTMQIQGFDVPATTYTSEINNGNTAYLVAVDSYPAQFNMSDVKTILEAGLNGQVSSEKATLVSSSYGTTAGLTSVTGHATLTIDNQPFDSYSTLFLKGNTLYQIVTVGTSESDFNNFVDSFHFTE